MVTSELQFGRSFSRPDSISDWSVLPKASLLKERSGSFKDWNSISIFRFLSYSECTFLYSENERGRTKLAIKKWFIAFLCDWSDKWKLDKEAQVLKTVSRNYVPVSVMDVTLTTEVGLKFGSKWNIFLQPRTKIFLEHFPFDIHGRHSLRVAHVTIHSFGKNICAKLNLSSYKLYKNVSGAYRTLYWASFHSKFSRPWSAKTFCRLFSYRNRTGRSCRQRAVSSRSVTIFYVKKEARSAFF